MDIYLEKSRAILLQAFKIAKKDNRDMRVILFGSNGEILEYEVDKKYDIVNFIKFIRQGFNGGTDFNTPFSRALEIINENKNYKFADIFAITDGIFDINNELNNKLMSAKRNLDLKIYTVIFGGNGYNYSSIEDYCDDKIYVY